MTVREKIAAGEYESKLESYVNIKDKVARVAAKRAYWEDQHRLGQIFKADLEKEHGIEGHLKADLLFSIAEEEGHSSGFSEILVWYERLVDLLVKPAEMEAEYQRGYEQGRVDERQIWTE